MRSTPLEEIKRVESGILQSIKGIEDGNGSVESGNIGPIYYGSSLSVTGGVTGYFYSTDFQFTLTQWNSQLRNKGNQYLYNAAFSFTTYQDLADRFGVYGPNLVKRGDFVTLYGNTSGNDYVNGYVYNLWSGTTYTSAGTGATATFTIYPSIMVTSGNPALSRVGDTAIFKRNVYKSSDIEERPSSPTVSYAASSNFYVTWSESNRDRVKGHIIKFRPQGSTFDTSDVKYLRTPGVYINGQGSYTISPLLATDGKLGTVIINDQNNNSTTPPSFMLVGDGTGASVRTSLDENGSLRIDRYTIRSYDNNSATLYLDPVKNTAQPGTGCYVENFPVSGVTYSVYTTNSVTGGYAITLKNLEDVLVVLGNEFSESNIGKEIKIHNGVSVTSAGSGYTRINYNISKYKENASFYYDSAVWGALTAGNYYVSVASAFDVHFKSVSDWSNESFLRIT